MTTPVLTATGVRKSYQADGTATEVLRGVDLEISEGELVAVMGPSGSGKSTLLYSLSGMERIDSGVIALGDTLLTTLDSDALADVRRTRMGFVFQRPSLLQDLNLLDNILLTSVLDRVGTATEREDRARELMERAGIWELRDRMPSQVSGGELQRAGICRALMRQPGIVFADEPTGALNSVTATGIMDLFVEINAGGTSLLIVTHDPDVAARADRVVVMRDGVIVDEVRAGDTPSNPLTTPSNPVTSPDGSLRPDDGRSPRRSDLAERLRLLGV